MTDEPNPTPVDPFEAAKALGVLLRGLDLLPMSDDALQAASITLGNMLLDGLEHSPRRGAILEAAADLYRQFREDLHGLAEA